MKYFSISGSNPAKSEYANSILTKINSIIREWRLIMLKYFL